MAVGSEFAIIDVVPCCKYGWQSITNDDVIAKK